MSSDTRIFGKMTEKYDNAQFNRNRDFPFFSFIVATKHASINLMLFMKLYICGIYTSAFNNLRRTVITVKNIFRGHTFSK